MGPGASENGGEKVHNSTTDKRLLRRIVRDNRTRGITEASPAYAKAHQLIEFLQHITALKPAEIAAIPPTSIMREFIGGQTL